MGEMLVKKADSHWADFLTPEQLAEDNVKLIAYLEKSPGGFIVEVQADGFFATPENLTGRGWRGDKFNLVKVTDGTVAQIYATIKNKEKIIIFNGHEIPASSEVLDLTKLDPPVPWETGLYPVRYIYTTTLSKLKYKTVDYSKVADLIEQTDIDPRIAKADRLK